MFLHEEVCFLPHPLQFGLFGLFDGISLSIFFGSSPEDGREVSSTNMLQFPKLIDAIQAFLFGLGRLLLLNFWSFGTLKLMLGPILLLAFHSAVVNALAPRASQQFSLTFATSLTLFLGALHYLV